MTYEIAFSDSQIVAFCRATRDSNRLHNPEFMAEHGKRAIVPGMMTLAYSLSLAVAQYGSDRTALSGIRSIDAQFGQVHSSGEELGFDVVREDRDGLETVVNSYKTGESGGLSQMRSVRVSGASYDIGVKGSSMQASFSAEEIGQFSAATGAVSAEAAGFLYALSFSSGALFSRLGEPQTDSEKEIASLLARGIVPVYLSLRFSVPNGIRQVNAGHVDYFLGIDGRSGGKGYAIRLQCSQAGEVLFRAEFSTRTVHEGIIIERMAANL
ncbi:MaoC family dehydratase [Candidatus Woesearchaeota archaeon]|nr:MaoC family dehydratase [Candidatus Woesearchaeota archaeon]